jgi:hypothetical protein
VRWESFLLLRALFLGIIVTAYAIYLSYKNPQELVDDAVLLGIGAIITIFLIKQGSSGNKKH